MLTSAEVRKEILSWAAVIAVLAGLNGIAKIAGIGVSWINLIATSVVVMTTGLAFGVIRRAWGLRSRGAKLAAWTQTLGLQYSQDTAPAPIGKSFFLERYKAIPLNYVISGDWRGLPIRYADYRNSLSDVNVFYFPVVCTELNIMVSYVEISRKNGLAQLAKTSRARAADPHPQRFNREFRVKSDDDEFTRKLIDSDMIAWLLSAKPKFRFEMAGSRLVVSCTVATPMRPSKLPSLLDAAVDFTDHIPRVVFDDYSTA